MDGFLYTKLPKRAFITVTGNDRLSFLQGLITQDLERIESEQLLYSCLLTPNGKFLHDFFIYAKDESLILDCEGDIRAQDLLKRLSAYKLRSDIDLKIEDDVDVWQIFSLKSSTIRPTDSASTLIHQDPRHSVYGYRSYTKPTDIEETPFDIWDEHRIRHEIPDGSRDMIPEKSFLHESEIIANTAISYTKGCYMGQELVSRMHHRGLAKKRLQCITIDEVTNPSELRSSCGKIALQLTKL